MFCMRLGLSVGVCLGLRLFQGEKEHGRAKNVELLG